MSEAIVRPFRRSDRDQVAVLVNRHAAAVVPGATASVNTILNQFEREPSEWIVDPWVAGREALVGEQNGAVVAAALLLTYRASDDVGERYRGTGEIRWLVFDPIAPVGNPHWSDGVAAGDALMRVALEHLMRSTGGIIHADGVLPVPGVYGVPEQWPHVALLYESAGFISDPALDEIVLLADLGGLRPARPETGLAASRTVGINGTRFTALRGDAEVGYIEVDLLDDGERRSRHGDLAEIGNLHADNDEIATWLLTEAAAWLRLAGVRRLLAYVAADETALLDRLRAFGFDVMTRTRRGWTIAGTRRMSRVEATG